MNKKQYTLKNERIEFLNWLISYYGYNVKNINDNTREISEIYNKERDKLIPKNTIYRWLKRYNHFIVDSFLVEANKYINYDLLNEIHKEIR